MTNSLTTKRFRHNALAILSALAIGSAVSPATNSISVDFGSITIQFASVPGEEYLLESSVDTASWSPLDDILAFTGSTIFSFPPPFDGEAQQFYRIRNSSSGAMVGCVVGFRYEFIRAGQMSFIDIAHDGQVLDDLFFSLRTGASPADADVVWVYEGEVATGYYFQDGPFGFGLSRLDDPFGDYSGTPLPRGSCIGVQSIESFDRELLLAGSFPEGPGSSTYDEWALAAFGPVLGFDSAPNADPDGDGLSNKEERDGATDPNNPNDPPQSIPQIVVTGISPRPDDASVVVMGWSSVSGQHYDIEEYNEAAGLWEQISSVLATTSAASYEIAVEPGKRSKLVRVVLRNE